MVNLDSLEFSYHDEALTEMQVCPSEVDLIIPRFILRERADQFKYWEEKMTAVLGTLQRPRAEVSTCSTCILKRKLIYSFHHCNSLYNLVGSRW